MKKTTVRNKNDKIWGEIIRTKGYCEYCGRQGRLYAHHIIGRSNYATRWDLRNGFCCCFSCHTGTSRSVHEDAPSFIVWLVNNRAEDLLYLNMKKHEEVKRTLEFYQKNLRELQNDYQRIQDQMHDYGQGT